MTLETAKALVSTITNSFQAALDAQKKIIALEKALQKYEPNLYLYLKELEEVRKHPPVSLSLGGLATLQSRLAQGT